jgi:hypothetical protein
MAASKLKEAKGLGTINSVKFSSEGEDGKDKIPKGATILNTETTVEVEEIENGFIISKRTQIKYQAPGKEYTDWSYNTKKYYSEDNPLSIDTEDKQLADLFQE